MLQSLYIFPPTMKLPLILTNAKTYQTAIGKAAVELAKIHEKVAQETGITFALAVQTADIFRVSSAVNIPIFAQHLDAVSYGSHTGWNLPEAIKEAGATGVILNHSEHRFSDTKELEKSVKRAKEVGLLVCICAESDEEGARIFSACEPDFIAVEPPELIGGDISISTAEPKLISDSVEKIGTGKVLVGAGVKNGEDVRIALELGAVGVLLASGVTKSNDPESVLKDLISKI